MALYFTLIIYSAHFNVNWIIYGEKVVHRRTAVMKGIEFLEIEGEKNSVHAV